MFNRILSLILAFVMVAGVFPVSAFAEEGGNDADLKQDNSLVIVSNEIDLNTLIHLGWEVGVMWQDGSQFIEPHSIRMNLALPLDRVQEAFARLDKYVFNR